jgi:hypothetical protein
MSAAENLAQTLAARGHLKLKAPVSQPPTRFDFAHNARRDEIVAVRLAMARGSKDRQT